MQTPTLSQLREMDFHAVLLAFAAAHFVVGPELTRGLQPLANRQLRQLHEQVADEFSKTLIRCSELQNLSVTCRCLNINVFPQKCTIP